MDRKHLWGNSTPGPFVSRIQGDISPQTIHPSHATPPRLRLSCAIHQMDALPLGSYGNSNAREPAKMTKPPATYTGTAVARFAYNAITGACGRCIPKLLHQTSNGNGDTHQHAKHPRCSGRQTVARPTILGGEYLCRDRIQHA